MRNAALFLGIIGGIVGMVVGFFGYGFAVLGELWGEFAPAARDAGVGEIVEDPMVTKILSVGAPVLAIAGAAMAPSRPAIAAILLILSALGMYIGFDFNVFTMFPIGMCGLAGLFALLGALVRPVAAHH
ncbi:MAG: hypothetical protein AAF334_07575 [Pseudomonadota bacterium]